MQHNCLQSLLALSRRTRCLTDLPRQPPKSPQRVAAGGPCAEQPSSRTAASTPATPRARQHLTSPPLPARVLRVRTCASLCSACTRTRPCRSPLHTISCWPWSSRVPSFKLKVKSSKSSQLVRDGTQRQRLPSFQVTVVIVGFVRSRIKITEIGEWKLCKKSCRNGAAAPVSRRQ